MYAGSQEVKECGGVEIPTHRLGSVGFLVPGTLDLDLEIVFVLTVHIHIKLPVQAV